MPNAKVKTTYFFTFKPKMTATPVGEVPEGSASTCDTVTEETP